MKQGLAIAALVVVIIAIFVPLYGTFLVALALALATIAALGGERPLAIATAAIAIVAVVFLSPVFWFGLSNLSAGEKIGAYAVVTAFLLAPFIAIYLNSNGKVKIDL
jgi:hypothetical protein